MTKYYVKAPIEGFALPVGAEVKVVTENSFSYEVDMGTHYEYISKDCIKVVELPENLDFGEALKFLKQGKKVARKGWNGKGQFVVYQKGYPNGIPCNKQTAEAWGINEGDLFKCEPYLQIRTADGSHAMWSPSVTDCLAEDWEVVE